MSEIALTEQLDQAIAAIRGNPNAPIIGIEPQVTELLGIAAELRALPRADFKARLRQELQREASMIATAAESQGADKSAHSKIREGFRTVTPYLTVADVHAEIEFVTRTFGATGTIYGLGSEGGFHSEYKIGESMIMIGGGGKGASWKGTPAPGSLHVYVEDVDAVYQRAMKAGATSMMAPTEQEYGDREAALMDVSGNHWYIATHRGADYLPAGMTNLMPYLHPQGAPKMIEFLKQAFNAEEIAVHQSPDGIVHHATVKVGSSIVEMGEAHGEWQPMPMSFMLYMENADESYARAMKAEGAVSISVPADQPYGARVGTVKDPFGNTWYISHQIATDEP